MASSTLCCRLSIRGVSRRDGPRRARGRGVIRAQASISRGERRTEAVLARPLSFFAGAAMAAALAALPVEAGVVLEQPQLKRIDTSTETDKGSSPVRRAAPSAASESSMGGGLNVDLGLLSLPLTLGGCAALYVAASRLDSDFDDFMSRAWLKDSAANGIGYEEVYKSTDYTASVKSRKR